MKKKHVDMYMRVAESVALASPAERLKVGAVSVNPVKNIPISYGYNALPLSIEGSCEYQNKEGVKITRPEVIHAEHNMLLNTCKSTESSYGCYVFITHSPCKKCSEMMINAGVKKVFYKNKYRDESGITTLIMAGVQVEQVI